MNRVVRVIAFLAITASAFTVSAAKSTRKRPASAAKPGSSPAGQNTAKAAKILRRNDAAPTARPLNLKVIQRRWTEKFIKVDPDDSGNTEFLFPRELEINATSLPAGSRAAAAFSQMAKQFGKDRITAFRRSDGTFAIQEATEGESDFRLRIYDATGKALLRVSIEDDGSVSWEPARPEVAEPVRR